MASKILMTNTQICLAKEPVVYGLKIGNFDLEDHPRSGCTGQIDNDRLNPLVESNRRQTWPYVAIIMECSHEGIHEHLQHL